MYIVACHLHTVTVLPLLFQFGYILYLLFVWLLWLGLPILCWISGESEHSCLVLDFSGKAFSLSVSCIIFAVCHKWLWVCYVPYIPTLVRVFIMNGCWILSKAFSASTEMVMCFFYFSFVNVVYDVVWFA